MKKRYSSSPGLSKRHARIAVSDSGFTLVEILIAMALVALFMGGLMAMFAGFSKSYTTENVKADVQQVVRGGVEHMVPYIRIAGLEPRVFDEPSWATVDPIDGNDAGFKKATATEVRFTADKNKDGYIDDAENPGTADKNEERITYKYEGDTLYRMFYNDPATQQPIISNVESFSFSYFDEDNIQITAPVPAGQLGNIRSVLITMTVKEPAGRDGFITRTYENRVRCRNLN